MGRKREHDQRGNNHDRCARKLRLLKTYGDGINVDCVWCGESLDYGTVTADRIIPGASYCFDNVIPSCLSCNSSRKDRPVEVFIQSAENPAFAYKLLFDGVFAK